jgi:hypothetical protein
MILTRYRADDPPAWANDPIEEEPVMREAPRHLIAAGPGRIRVLRCFGDGDTLWTLRYEARLGAGCCRLCGCTARWACPGGCAWVTAARDLCSRCFEKELLS